MARDTVHVGGYLPLFAGSEIVRRSGSLTQFPSDQLLGNLPPTVAPGYPWFDSFTSIGSQELADHVAEYGSEDRKYAVNFGCYTVLGDRVQGNCGDFGPYAATRPIEWTAPLGAGGRWREVVWPADDSTFAFTAYGSGFPWSGFDDPLVSIQFAYEGGARIAYLRRGLYNQSSITQSFFYDPGQPIEIIHQFNLEAAFCTTSMLTQPGLGSAQTSIPSSTSLRGEFRVSGGAGLDELALLVE